MERFECTKTKLNAKIINFSFDWIIEIHIDIHVNIYIHVDIHIEAKFEKKANQPFFGLDIYSRSATA
jgi:hypothetical protein